MSNMPETIDTLLRLTMADLSRSLASLEFIGATLASAHLSAAVDTLREDYGIELPQMRVILLPDHDLTVFEQQIEIQFSEKKKR